MGLVSILGSTLKNLPWRTIATTAMDHAPELYRKAREHFGKNNTSAVSATEIELNDRIARLEALLLEQDALIRQQQVKCDKLEKDCITLEGRLFSFKIVSGILFFAAMILLALLLK